MIRRRRRLPRSVKRLFHEFLSASLSASILSLISASSHARSGSDVSPPQWYFVMIAAARSSRPCATSQRGDSGTHQTSAIWSTGTRPCRSEGMRQAQLLVIRKVPNTQNFGVSGQYQRLNLRQQ